MKLTSTVQYYNNVELVYHSYFTYIFRSNIQMCVECSVVKVKSFKISVKIFK